MFPATTATKSRIRPLLRRASISSEQGSRNDCITFLTDRFSVACSLELLGLEANVRDQREIGAHLKSVIAFCSFPSIVRDLQIDMSFLYAFWWKLSRQCRIHCTNGRLSSISWDLRHLRRGFHRHDIESVKLET